jgi:hypothetical protein
MELLKLLELKIEEYRTLNELLFKLNLPQIKAQSIFDKGSLLKGFIDNYNVSDFIFFEKMIFNDLGLTFNNRYSVFAENVLSNLYYAEDNFNEGRVCCFDFDENYLMDVSSSFEEFFLILIEMLKMEIKRLSKSNYELEKDEYIEFFNKHLKIIDNNEKLIPFAKFICCM